MACSFITAIILVGSFLWLQLVFFFSPAEKKILYGLRVCCIPTDFYRILWQEYWIHRKLLVLFIISHLSARETYSFCRILAAYKGYFSTLNSVKVTTLKILLHSRNQLKVKSWRKNTPICILLLKEDRIRS